jgi:uncharacterized protein (UPF0210 family)
MRIRSLTIGAALPADEEERALLIDRLGNLAQAGRAALEAGGFTVQTTRLSTQPMEEWLEPSEGITGLVAELGRHCASAGIDYCSLGTIQAALPLDDDRNRKVSSLQKLVPDILLAADNVFASIQVGARSGESGLVNLEAVQACAEIIGRLAISTANGFGNLRFAAAANCPPHIPFFPASYYVQTADNNGGPEFGLALEAADLAVRAFEGARSHDEARGNLLALLIEQGSKAAEICVRLGTDYGYRFTGLDISMAPYPEPERSIARALEMLGRCPLGAPGSLAAAAFFTDVLREARNHLPTVGYSGLMLPVLEDQTLADRAAQGLVGLDTLLLLSAVCGLGLDTLPLPGDVTTRQLEHIIFDMAALAVRLDKPLTARLLPVPGKQAGEAAQWPDFPYFAHGRIMPVPPLPTEGAGLFTGKWVRFS